MGTYTIAQQTDTTLVIDGQGPCGLRFERVAIVHDWQGENPLLAIPHPLGFNGVRKILAMVNEIKARTGEGWAEK